MPAEIPSYSIILETENLSLADDDCLWLCLGSIAHSLSKAATQPDVVLVINSGDISDGAMRRLSVDYPFAVVTDAPAGANYYESKMHGLGLVDSEIVVFADSDCRYNEEWLSGLLAPFRDPGVKVVAGQTAFGGRGPYALAMNVIHSFDGFSGGTGLQVVNGYYANNFAARRSLLLERPMPTRLPLYRHCCSWHCVQLRLKGEVIYSQPQSRAYHALPDGLSHFFWRFLLFGRDRAVRARLGLVDDAPRAVKHASGPFGVATARLQRALRQDPWQILWMPLAFPIVLAAALLIRSGQFLSRRNPELAIGHFGAIEGVHYPTLDEYLGDQTESRRRNG